MVFKPVSDPLASPSPVGDLAESPKHGFLPCGICGGEHWYEDGPCYAGEEEEES